MNVRETLELRLGRMPASRLRRTIGSLKRGESGWTVPWSLEVAADRTYKLDLDAPVEREKTGNTNMKVTRTAKGWTVSLPAYAKWTLPATKRRTVRPKVRS